MTHGKRTRGAGQGGDGRRARAKKQLEGEREGTPVAGERGGAVPTGQRPAQGSAVDVGTASGTRSAGRRDGEADGEQAEGPAAPSPSSAPARPTDRGAPSAEGGGPIPEFLREQLSAAYDEAACARVLAGCEAARSRPVTLRANALKAGAGEVAAALDAAGIAYERVPWYADAFILRGVRERAVWELPLYQEGRVYLQSLSSMLPAIALAPRAGADILDMCAAPGGKTSQICALTGGGAHVTACEMNGPRAEKLAYNLQKLGAGGVNIMRVDARRLDDFFRFDQVLVDAPCTGSGTVRAGDARAERRITPKLLEKVTRSQAQLLDRALTVLKPGGTLVYSTCSVLPTENEEQVERALARHRDCELEPVAATPAGAAQVPMLPCRLDGALTICPGALFEGFFIARIKKKAR